MPRSHGVIKVEVWEVGSEFRRLDLEPQWAYEMLISQPQINNLGLLPYVPEKWSRLAADLDRARLDQALTVLETLRYTITDVETGELLVRTFIRHDGVWKHSKLVINARRLFREVESHTIRAYLAERHPWLTDDSWKAPRIVKHETGPHTPDTGLEDEPDLPLRNGEHDGEPEPQPEGEPNGEHDGQSPPCARAQDALPQDQGQDQGLPPLDTSKGFLDAAPTTRRTALGSHDIKSQIETSLSSTRQTTA